MVTAPNQKLLEFVRRLRADLTPDGTITRMELYHSVEGHLGERLCTIEMADRDEDEDPDDLAQEIWNEAEDDASTRPTGAVERYIVQAFRGDTREPDEQKAFTTLGKMTTALVGNASEPPTETGMRMAGMRQTNDLHALLVRVCESTAGSAAIALAREREEVERLRQRTYQYEEARQKLLDRELERELARKDAEESQKQTSMVFGALMQLAPLVLTRLIAPPAPQSAAQPLPATPSPQPAPAPSSAGHAAPPAPPSDRDIAIAQLLASVSQEQMGALLKAFTPEQQQQFLRVYTSFRAEAPNHPGVNSHAN